LQIDLAFQNVGAQWRPFAISVSTVEPKTQAAAPAAH
jgi:hypothetical protein